MNTTQTGNIKIRVTNLTFSYKGRRILDGINENFEEFAVTAIIGPSGVGKSTFLMTLNRLWENIPEAQMSGKVEIRFNGGLRDIYERSFSSSRLRKLVGTVFQKPNPLPMSIFRNVAFPLKLSGEKDKGLIAQKVEGALRKAYLWDEVKDRLAQSALALSGGQQQRLCIARSLILEPEVLLLDEPTSSLDEKAAEVIEDLILHLKERITILAVSHYLDQVKRIADRVVQVDLWQVRK
ncbi:MAG TPA: ATP-binding cassette domain-containing protein [Syntrophorhabdaceae bacterium]|jgi:phosphate transport system ATP-binding protein|nr:ATP-binding cassette domain-containing protein [Syntrophorhabdaceae bacterium]HNT69806.1 ATP-binding cassette domain-containing protein [Syntrophorhabdaceae bacterium]